MSDSDNGGPAFPALCQYVDGKPTGAQVGSSTGWETGMTLLDYFTGQALAGLLLCIQSTANDNLARGVPREQVDQITRSSLRTIAEKAYDLAEHLIVEKRKRDCA